VLALLDFAVAAAAVPGTVVAVDLARVQLGSAVLASRPGADGTDGRILVRPAGTPVVLTGTARDLSAPEDTDIDPITGTTRAARARLLG